MAYSPSIGDIVLVCQFANTVWTKFKGAPDEFKEVTREVGSLALILEDIEVQSQHPWSPLRRNRQRAAGMKACVTASNTKLRLLSEQMDRYNSLGSQSPKALERVQYITRNLDPLREELRRSRQEIDTQLELCNTDVLGRILKIVSERAADERAGKRQTVISSGGADDDDVLSVVTQDLHRHRIPESDIETHKPDIEAYVRELRAEGASNEGDEFARTELNPSDSVSQLDVNMASLPIAKQASHSDVSKSRPIELFHGIPIQDISYHTIINPHTGLRGIRLPGTFDVWDLAERSWSLQRRLTRGIERSEMIGDRDPLAQMLDTLCAFDPSLLVAIAYSSTNKDYWSRLVDSHRKVGTDRRKTHYDDWHSVPEIGKGMIQLLYGINQELDRWESHARQTSNTDVELLESHLLKPPESRESSFTRFKKSLRRSSSAHSTHSNQAPAKDARFEWRPFNVLIAPVQGPDLWVEVLKSFCLRFQMLTASLDLTTPTRFSAAIGGIESSWSSEYRSAARMSSARSSNNDPGTTEANQQPDLLIQWLLFVMGIPSGHGDSLVRLSEALGFPIGKP